MLETNQISNEFIIFTSTRLCHSGTLTVLTLNTFKYMTLVLLSVTPYLGINIFLMVMCVRTVQSFYKIEVFSWVLLNNSSSFENRSCGNVRKHGVVQMFFMSMKCDGRQSEVFITTFYSTYQVEYFLKCICFCHKIMNNRLVSIFSNFIGIYIF